MSAVLSVMSTLFPFISSSLDAIPAVLDRVGDTLCHLLLAYILSLMSVYVLQILRAVIMTEIT